MEQMMQQLEPDLGKVVQALFASVAQIAELLRTPKSNQVGSRNAFGDQQLEADLASDRVVFAALRACGAVASASSEETTEVQQLGGSRYSVSFDPLDGSSIIGANWAVGSIFGIWKGDQLLGQTGRSQVAAAYAVYGPRTVLVTARPTAQEEPDTRVVQEYVLRPDGSWSLVRDSVTIGEKQVFAPANLRAAANNVPYKQLVHSWMDAKLTLRYSGGMVPDVHHILTVGGGIFCSPASSAANPKLRLLYECAPLAFVVEAAGGASHDGSGSVLDQRVETVNARTVVSLGSKQMVTASVPALRAR